MEDRVYASEVAIELEAVGIATNHLLHREGAEPAVIELFRGSLCPDIPTVQPDLVANLKWFCLPVVSVVITCHIEEKERVRKAVSQCQLPREIKRVCLLTS